MSLGPRDDGRDYGLLPRFKGIRLPGTASAALGDFSLALFDWGLQPRPPFAAFFPIDRDLHFLARAAFVREGGYGPVARANGLLLDSVAMTALQGRAHRLLDLVEPAEAGEWAQTEIEAALPSPPPPPEGGADLARIGRALHLARGKMAVEIATGLSAEAALAAILEAARSELVRIDAWATNRALNRIGRFDPAAFRLEVVAVPASAPIAPDAHRLGPAGLSGLPLPESGVDDLWHVLFGEPPDSAWSRSHPEAAAALRSAVDTYPRDRLGEDAPQVLVEEMLAAIRRVGAQVEPMWALIEYWAQAASSLDTARQTAVSTAIALLLRRLIAIQSADVRKAELLKGYLARIRPRLKRAPPLLAAALAAEHGLIALLDPSELGPLVSNGLGDAYAEALRSEARSGRLSDDQTSAIAGAMRGLVHDGAAPESLAAALTLVARPPAAASPSGDRLAAELLELGEALLLVDSPTFEWKKAVPPLVGALRRAEKRRLRSEVVDRFFASARHFWKDRRDRDRNWRRRWAVMVARLHLREASA